MALDLALSRSLRSLRGRKSAYRYLKLRHKYNYFQEGEKTMSKEIKIRWGWLKAMYIITIKIFACFVGRICCDNKTGSNISWS